MNVVKEPSMSLNELKEQVVRLSKSDRLALVRTIIESLQEDNQVSKNDHTKVIQQMRGLLKVDQNAPTNKELVEMLTEPRSKVCVLQNNSRIYSNKTVSEASELEEAKSVSRLIEAGYLVIQKSKG